MVIFFLDLRYFAHGIVYENKEIADMCNGRIILCMRPANKRWHYIATMHLIGCAHAQNDLSYG